MHSCHYNYAKLNYLFKLINVHVHNYRKTNLYFYDPLDFRHRNKKMVAWNEKVELGYFHRPQYDFLFSSPRQDFNCGAFSLSLFFKGSESNNSGLGALEGVGALEAEGVEPCVLLPLLSMWEQDLIISTSPPSFILIMLHGTFLA